MTKLINLRSACVLIHCRLFTKYGFIPFYYSDYVPCEECGKACIVKGNITPFQKNGETKILINKHGILYTKILKFIAPKDNLSPKELSDAKRFQGNYYHVKEQIYMDLRNCSDFKLGYNQIAITLNNETIYLNDGDYAMFAIDDEGYPFIIHCKNE